MSTETVTPIQSSFRDPSGSVFVKNKQIFRSVNLSYKTNFDHLLSSKLYDRLTEKNLIVSFDEVAQKNSAPVYKVIKPEQIPFISYPYEWSFSQLKDAALLTLEIQKIALDYGMTLKDASAYNIQFLNGRPILIDSLSFEIYQTGTPWIAYRQFCQHFLAPLALMSYNDIRLNCLLKEYIDGVPLDLATKLLPGKAKWSLGLFSHLYLHAGGQKKYQDKKIDPKSIHLSLTQLKGIIASLQSTILRLKMASQETVWDDYYNEHNYTDADFKQKFDLVDQWVDQIKPQSIWDAGANDATFSQIGSKKNILTIASDFDSNAVEFAYLSAKKRGDKYLLPLVVDLTNPSAGIGFCNTERPAFLERGKFELTFALALIHHLAISNNLPLSYLAKFFANQTKYLIIEFVPKSDSNAQKLLQNREDIFEKYDQANFEDEFGKHFSIRRRVMQKNGQRILYLMEKR